MINRISLTAKKGGHITQDVLDAQLEAMYNRLEAELLKNVNTTKRASTGVFGKAFEPIVRHLLTARGLLAHDAHARTNGNSGHWKGDGMLRLEGDWFSYEIKSGDGIVGWLDPTEDPVWGEDDILPGIDLVFYATDPKNMQCLKDVLDRTCVFTRQEFISYLATEGPKRSQSVRTATKAATNDGYLRGLNRDEGRAWRDCIILQTTYHMARAMAIKSGRYLTLRSFLREHGRL